MKQVFLFITLLIVLTFSTTLFAQERSFGFKTGINVSTINGPSEQNAAGEDLEEFTYTTGFHIGAGMNFNFTDRFGLRTEVIYTQKGRRYRYSGDSFQVFTTEGGNEVNSFGLRTTTINVNQSYIEVPVSGFARVLPWLEFSAGLYGGVVIGSTGTGEWFYSGTTEGGVTIDEFLVTLDHNYFRDQPDDEPSTAEVISFSTGSETVTIPRAIGAYYDIPRDKGNVYNGFDAGALAGVSLYFNESLFLGARFSFGFLDMTNTDYDVSRATSDGLNYILRDDKDQNFSMQFSVGFSF